MRRAVVSLAFTSMLALAGACTPELAPEGTYKCTDNASCPAKQGFCHPFDTRCYSFAETDSGNPPTNGPDGAMMMPGNDAMGPSGNDATVLPDDATTPPGMACDRAGDPVCRGNSHCAIGRWGTLSGTYTWQCATDAVLTAQLGDSCVSSGGCAPPFECVGAGGTMGVCVRPCPLAGTGASGLQLCGGTTGEECRPVPPAVTQTASSTISGCFTACAGRNTPCAPGGVSRFTCRAVGASGEMLVCLPTPWPLS